MNFEIDAQTKKDLNIFSQSKGESSVFDYYNYTSTIGGKKTLEQLISSPLNKPNEINNRVSIIKFLKESQINIHLDKGNLDLIEHYLNSNSPILNDSIIASIANWSSNRFKPNNDYYIVCQGLKRLKKHLQMLYVFIKSVKSNDIPEFILQLRTELENIASTTEFNVFINSNNTSISFRQINYFDNLIRIKEKERIKNIMRFTYYLDAYSSVAKSAQINNLSFSTISKSLNPKLRIQGLFHPLINNPVANDFTIGDKQNLCFVSGANMAGKSTFLKSVGLCVYLSHVGFPVPATTMETTLFNGLCSTINISDNIDKGYSHFYSEVKRVKETVLAIKEKKKVLVIFDELFRGTNVKDAFDATAMIVSGFTQIRNSLFLVSTHIVEVAKELEKHEEVSFKCFVSRLEFEKPIYNYKLNDGISSERHGLTIVKNEKIMEIINQIAEENIEKHSL